METDYGDKLDDEGRNQLQLLNGRARRMNSLIDGVLEYSRAGRTSEEKELVDIYEAVREVIDLLSPPEHIDVRIEGGLPTVMAEPIRIRQVFQNLISNAIKYLDKEEGHVRISAEKKDRFWRFSVSDNGPGIDRKYHDRIFGLFKTLARRDDRESTGVGLSIVEKIVVANEGSIWIESEV
ncbi:MAG: sensor histidine kinase, partial [Limisphaerales bacterium]